VPDGLVGPLVVNQCLHRGGSEPPSGWCSTGVRRGSGTGRTWSGISAAPGRDRTATRATRQTVATGPVARQQGGEPTL
jgi:hypothetical protein